MEAKALDSCTGSGITSGVASVPAAAGCDAPTRPEATVPITMPMANVTVTRRVARTLRFRAQAANSLSCMPMLFTPPSRSYGCGLCLEPAQNYGCGLHLELAQNFGCRLRLEPAKNLTTRL